MDMDFGYGQNVNTNGGGSDNKSEQNQDVTNLDNGQVENPNGGENINEPPAGKEKNENNENDNPTKLEEGTTLEIGDAKYTVDKDGNVVDSNGNIFKEASQVSEWMKEFENVEENTSDISIDSIKAAIGIEITDDNDNPIVFDNTVEGIKSYVDSVIETSKQEHYDTAINTLYQKYPIVKDVINYYVANGNSIEGFGQVPDRSGIEIDENNEAQQEQIIRTAWSERKQRGDVNSYINYLKSSGTLLATAKEELDGLKEADAQYKRDIEAKAAAEEKEKIETLERYWNGVHDIIKSRKIAGYQIPESIVITRDGQKLSVTPEDFFNYIYRVDKEGKSAYERDLEAETPDVRRDDEILRAYLKYVGGNYSNLVDMAINEKNVATLKLRAKQHNASAIRVTKPKSTKSDGANIDLGYN